MLPRYNAAWLDPGCEAKLRQSGAAATVVAPRWEGKVRHQALTEMAVAERVVLPRRDLFRPGQRAGRDMPRAPRWAVSVSRRFAGDCQAASLQPYLSAINGFYRDHGAEPVAQGDLISKFTAVSADCQQPGAATAAYAIGVVLQKIKHFGGWAQLSIVVLDYINPT
eukprot:jgi/Tetstr1/427993/TSEL_018066.t1